MPPSRAGGGERRPVRAARKCLPSWSRRRIRAPTIGDNDLARESLPHYGGSTGEVRVVLIHGGPSSGRAGETLGVTRRKSWARERKSKIPNAATRMVRSSIDGDRIPPIPLSGPRALPEPHLKIPFRCERAGSSSIPRWRFPVIREFGRRAIAPRSPIPSRGCVSSGHRPAKAAPSAKTSGRLKAGRRLEAQADGRRTGVAHPLGSTSDWLAGCCGGLPDEVAAIGKKLRAAIEWLLNVVFERDSPVPPSRRQSLIA